MKSLRKRYERSTSTGKGRKSGKKSRAARNKLSTKEHSRPKKNIQTANTKATQSQSRAMKEKRKKKGKPKLKVRSPVLRSKTVRKHMGNVSSTIKNSPRMASSGSAVKKRVIRVLDHGQFLVDRETLRELNTIDNSIVRRLQNGNLDDQEYKTKITQLEGIVKKRGKPLDPKRIVASDIILPNSDLSIEEARMIFNNEGIIPGLD